jgi:hypothetical protein
MNGQQLLNGERQWDLISTELLPNPNYLSPSTPDEHVARIQEMHPLSSLLKEI